jgi:hypothetical protein
MLTVHHRFVQRQLLFLKLKIEVNLAADLGSRTESLHFPIAADKRDSLTMRRTSLRNPTMGEAH